MRAGSQDENMMRSDVPPLSCWRCVPYALIEVLAIFLAQNERKKIGFSYLDILYFLIWRCILGGRLSCWAIAAGYIHCQFKSSKCWDDNVQNQTEIKVKRIWRWQTQHWQHHFSTTTASFIYLRVSFLANCLLIHQPAIQDIRYALLACEISSPRASNPLNPDNDRCSGGLKSPISGQR